MPIQAPALAPLALDGRLLAVLALVGAEGPALQARLAERLQVDRTTMVALVDRLEQAGLVERHRDSADRRGYHVNITTTGSTALKQALGAVQTVERDFLSALSKPEQDRSEGFSPGSPLSRNPWAARRAPLAERSLV